MAKNPKKVLLGVTGSIAAYKAAELARLMMKRDWDVWVVMSACATQYVGPGPGVEVIAKITTDSVIAAAVQYELDHDQEALSRRLDALGVTVRALAGLG